MTEEVENCFRFHYIQTESNFRFGLRDYAEGEAMTVSGTPLTRGMAEFNRWVTNRVIGLLAPHVPWWAVLIHRGRKSGKEYRTPVAITLRDGSMMVPVGYGEESDWLRNLLAADGGQVVHRGRTRTFANPRVIDREETGGWGRITRIFVADFV
ncbi:nitroreductase family deazaflavin-dependent oxidoreductase [Mycobacterium sp. CBMA293]|uniref:nitroreductase family deazaflavin-dependent oxidoreductase n=1 Tax=unclassified Mycolicibacterium TaxID=2636767 RepID=UPI0012DCBA24|nr:MULTISPECIES: nitroreductase family deazaflavin-dependent oxidoreductase [unclassified Mycolicibacterium]MUL48269.1 nitroreductase family deazaflavin-dependent oxidoreductase [Mycolicibacterium sp. CBMA 360]MUL57563.1 nitroreductase family deazaflavin-dependent oxidoreductase [Mycolicibacterium sp. CBMA 335]MUL70603.1 nitroreductase family deazaflavin-dependent oxidoreductase [Mycolicibacterium sp. CBMA 311]MUL92651.1 nitroreductase family deazaflavin-dependent oxidoreductase [Mycolicibacter